MWKKINDGRKVACAPKWHPCIYRTSHNAGKLRLSESMSFSDPQKILHPLSSSFFCRLNRKVRKHILDHIKKSFQRIHLSTVEVGGMDFENGIGQGRPDKTNFAHSNPNSWKNPRFQNKHCTIGHQGDFPGWEDHSSINVHTLGIVPKNRFGSVDNYLAEVLGRCLLRPTRVWRFGNKTFPSKSNRMSCSASKSSLGRFVGERDVLFSFVGFPFFDPRRGSFTSSAFIVSSPWRLTVCTTLYSRTKPLGLIFFGLEEVDIMGKFKNFQFRVTTGNVNQKMIENIRNRISIDRDLVRAFKCSYLERNQFFSIIRRNWSE